MPQYVFKNVKTGRTQEFFYSMKEAPSVGSIVTIEGVEWKREFTLPQAAPNGLKPIDPHSTKQFVQKTGAMKGTLGDLWDASAELSARRAEKNGGEDPVKEKFYERYSSKRKGATHTAKLAENQRKAQKKLEKALNDLGLASAKLPT